MRLPSPLHLPLALAGLALGACWPLGGDDPQTRQNFEVLTRSFERIPAGVADARAAAGTSATSSLKGFGTVPAVPAADLGGQDLSAVRTGTSGTVDTDLDGDGTAGSGVGAQEPVRYFKDADGTVFLAYRHGYLDSGGLGCLAWQQGDTAWLMIVGAPSSPTATVCWGPAGAKHPTCADCSSAGCGQSCDIDSLAACTTAPTGADAGGAACQDACAAGSVRCASSFQVQRCSTPTTERPCRDWEAAEACLSGRCEEGRGCL